MATLTGKTIGELTQLSAITNDTLFVVENSGATYNLPFSSITNYSEVTYDELYSLYTGSTLTPGKFYLITDFQTCYDQPNFNSEGSPITVGNFKTGDTEPIMVFATSNEELSPQAFSPSNPKDLLKYDITFTVTEVTNTPAKGRITERIDEKNNRADYDFRAVQFIRYPSFFSERIYNGTVSMDFSGNIVGIGTRFSSDFTVGNLIGVHTTGYEVIGGFVYYEIVGITGATNMTVTGNTYYEVFDEIYSYGESGPNLSPFQPNVAGELYTGYSEYYTFDNGNYSNIYLGDNTLYDTFILSNNVFLLDSENNTFGGNVVGNTFDDYCYDNTFGPYFQYNIIRDSFYRNTIGPRFQYNHIICRMFANNIGSSFVENMLADYDSYEFQGNTIGYRFDGNFFTFNNGDFRNNLIGEDFQNNSIDDEFMHNTITGYFSNNIIDNSFNENQIGYDFYNNEINDNFILNNINGRFYENKISSQFFNNTLGTFYNVVVEDIDNFNSFENNVILVDFTRNLILDGGFGGNPIFYSPIPTNVLTDVVDSTNYVTFLSSRTIVNETVVNYGTPFIAVFRTTTPDEEIQLPYDPSGSYEGIIDWGDGTTDDNIYENRYHTYSTPGDYTITISGITQGWSFGSFASGSSSNIISVNQWGTLKLSGNAQFKDCTNLTLSGVTDVIKLNRAYDLSSMFQNCTSIDTINRIDEWNLSDVNYLGSMFEGVTLFNQSISGWNVSNVFNMDRMFYGASSFNQDLSGWCVQIIGTPPTDFDTGATAWVLPKPIWGSCP